jgi:hypothetical protein
MPVNIQEPLNLDQMSVGIPDEALVDTIVCVQLRFALDVGAALLQTPKPAVHILRDQGDHDAVVGWLWQCPSAHTNVSITCDAIDAAIALVNDKGQLKETFIESPGSTDVRRVDKCDLLCERR